MHSVIAPRWRIVWKCCIYKAPDAVPQSRVALIYNLYVAVSHLHRSAWSSCCLWVPAICQVTASSCAVDSVPDAIVWSHGTVSTQPGRLMPVAPNGGRPRNKTNCNFILTLVASREFSLSMWFCRLCSLPCVAAYRWRWNCVSILPDSGSSSQLDGPNL